MKATSFMFNVLAVLTAAFVCCGCPNSVDEPEPEPDPVEQFKIDETYRASLSSIQKEWAGEYEGYDANQEADTKIKRLLNLNSNGSYTNIIQGVLKKENNDDYFNFEKEAGTYKYDAEKCVITFTVKYDSVLNYQTEQYIGYSKKHYYAPNNGTTNDKSYYTENVQFTTPQSGTRAWVTEDTYLQSLTEKELNIWFKMDPFKGE